MDRVVFQRNSATFHYYDKGQVGVLVGFCHNGDDKEAIAIVRKTDGHYVNAPLRDIIYNGEAK